MHGHRRAFAGGRQLQMLRQQHHAGRLRLLLVGLRLGWEFALPLTLLIGTRLLLGTALGAQSWGEILSAFPDFGAWLWAISLLVLLTGATRFVLLLRVLRHADGEHRMAAPAVPTSQRPA